jgi:outer membrane protein assembly factor BamA
LLKKNDVEVQSGIDYRKIRKNIEENLSLERKLATLTKQQPNRKTLGLFKLNLTIYNRFYADSLKGLYRWITTTIGEPPVLFDSASLASSSQIMQEYMISKGYLLSTVHYDYSIRKKRATPHYYIMPGSLYSIDSVFYPTDTSLITSVLHSTQKNTLLKKGNAFDADVIGNEQLRLFREFQNKGYYHFVRDIIVFMADTFNSTRKANLYVKTQPSGNAEDFSQHYINDIYIFPNYDPEQQIEFAKHDTVEVDGNFFINDLGTVKPSLLIHRIVMKKGAMYSRDDYDFTINRLADLGIFKFISIRYSENAAHQLDAIIYLTPGKKHAVTAEIEASNIEDNVGGALKLSYKDKNVFFTGNQFDIGLNAGTQIPVFNKDSLIFNLSGQLNFYLPRFLPGNYFTSWTPRTRLTALANYYQQTNIYELNNYSFTYGYEGKKNHHRLLPNVFSVSYVNSTILSAEFQERLNADPFLKQTFEDLLITGFNNTYIYSNQDVQKRRDFTFFRISGELAGSIIYPLNTLLGDGNLDTSGHYKLFGINYANFFRAEIDIRHYFRFSQNRTFVTRFSAGEAINYWNSDVVPYIKQFYLGGTSSMRAWRVRSLGPGSYTDTSIINFFNSAGDIKIEANLEYRFNIFGRLNGALFADAGNIWLRKYDPFKPGANFRIATFMEEIAIGTGIGFRLDFSFFVLRLDVATPLRDPAAISSDRWVITDFDLLSSAWRKDNLLFNLAIGYPF